MSRKQERPRPPAAHQRGRPLHDPEDLAIAPLDRLISARAILTSYVRALDLLEEYDAAMQLRLTNPRRHHDAPAKKWIREKKGIEDPAERQWDEDELEAARRLVHPDDLGRIDPKSGHTQRRAHRGWPPHTTYGSEEWYQLRWRPYWRLDQGQKFMDRFELGEHWWSAIYADRRFPSERRFDQWRNHMTDGHRGVVWAAPTRDGRLEEPALAIVVVASTRRPRRTANWPIYLPSPEWPAHIRARYVERRYDTKDDWESLTTLLDALAVGGTDELQALARRSLHDRIAARGRRRG